MLSIFHDSRDDLAPRDYVSAPSVTEGVRRQRAQRMHRDYTQDVLAPAQEMLKKPAPIVPPKVEQAQPAKVEQAQPFAQAQPVDEYGLPEDPFHPPEETQRPRRSRVARNAEMPVEPAVQAQPVVQNVKPAQPVQAQPFVQAQPARQMTGARVAMPQFDKPASPDIPDWLKTAQHNNAPVPPRPQGPRVQAAPRMSDGYQQAGYPEELLEAQRELEYQQSATPVRRRHGAQYAVKPTYAPQPQAQPFVQAQPAKPVMPEPQRVQPTEEGMMSRAYHRPRREEPENYRVEEDDEELDERTVRIPWIPILAFVAVLAAVILWIMQVSFEKQTRQVLDDRAAHEAQILQEHPLKYRELISDKANKYNLHPAFVAAIMLNESSFRPDATSSVDARGLMQLMDDTAGWIYDKMDDPSRAYDFDDLYDPEINAEYGCWYLNYLSELFYGDPVLVAAAFHAGQGEVRNWLNDSAYSKDGRTLPLENMIDGPTKRYVTRVLDDFAAYKRLYFGG